MCVYAFLLDCRVCRFRLVFVVVVAAHPLAVITVAISLCLHHHGFLGTVASLCLFPSLPFLSLFSIEEARLFARPAQTGASKNSKIAFFSLVPYRPFFTANHAGASPQLPSSELHLRTLRPYQTGSTSESPRTCRRKHLPRPVNFKDVSAWQTRKGPKTMSKGKQRRKKITKKKNSLPSVSVHDT